MVARVEAEEEQQGRTPYLIQSQAPRRQLPTMLSAGVRTRSWLWPYIRHRTLGYFTEVSTWLFFYQGVILALVAVEEVLRRISASMEMTQHLVQPPYHVLSVLWSAPGKDFLAGFVVLGYENREFV